MVAAGRADGYFEFGPTLPAVCAGLAVVKAASAVAQSIPELQTLAAAAMSRRHICGATPELCAGLHANIAGPIPFVNEVEHADSNEHPLSDDINTWQDPPKGHRWSQNYTMPSGTLPSGGTDTAGAQGVAHSAESGDGSDTAKVVYVSKGERARFNTLRRKSKVKVVELADVAGKDEALPVLPATALVSRRAREAELHSAQPPDSSAEQVIAQHGEMSWRTPEGDAALRAEVYSKVLDLANPADLHDDPQWSSEPAIHQPAVASMGPVADSRYVDHHHKSWNGTGQGTGLETGEDNLWVEPADLDTEFTTISGALEHMGFDSSIDNPALTLEAEQISSADEPLGTCSPARQQNMHPSQAENRFNGEGPDEYITLADGDGGSRREPRRLVDNVSNTLSERGLGGDAEVASADGDHSNQTLMTSVEVANQDVPLDFVAGVNEAGRSHSNVRHAAPPAFVASVAQVADRDGNLAAGGQSQRAEDMKSDYI